MFGFVMADMKELSHKQRSRYNQVYCGVCRHMCQENGTVSRFALQYDMAFLALVLMSLYEPEESSGNRACRFHPIRPKKWVGSTYVAYSGDMNLALAYYKALDDAHDEGKRIGKKTGAVFKKAMDDISRRYPRQCKAMEDCLAELAALEKENCENPDLPANCFGRLMAELFVFEEDMWAPKLRQMGMALGRFIYLADAMVDYKKDKDKGRYNPIAAAGGSFDPDKWEQCLVLEMGIVTRYYESLPLVQDKEILDNILYSGIWLNLRRKKLDRSI